MRRALRLLGTLGVAALAGCASSRSLVQISPRSAGGNDVRLDAEIAADVAPGSNAIPIHYTVTNGRANAIAIADMLPDSSSDPERQLLTVIVGSDVPGENFLPRLLVVQPGESRSFAATARIAPAQATDGARLPRDIRIVLHFLRETEPFGELIGITQRAVEDPAYATAVYRKWLALNETIITNTIAIRSDGRVTMSGSSTARPGS